jgi:hypothetical protein
MPGQVKVNFDRMPCIDGVAPERNMKRKGGLVAKLKLSEPGKPRPEH